MYSLARDINDNGQPARLAGLGDKVGRDKLGNGLGEVDAVDKDVDCCCVSFALLAYSEAAQSA